VARKPENFEWIGFNHEQIEQLNFFDHIGNNAWGRNSQTEALMPGLLKDWADEQLTLRQLQDAMRAIGYSDRALHMLARWESKRTTGSFGR
jgi:hypothetical protein